MQLGKRNRWWEILKVLTKHGFPFFLSKHKDFKNWEWWEPEQQKEVARRLRVLFEDLGPTYIKLGQLLSTRPDLIPRQLVKELTFLQDRVEPMTSEEVRQQILDSQGRPPEEVFAFFEYCPTASASIGQVHFAILTTGERVAVKIQRPHIREIITKDIIILKKLLPFLSKQLFLDRVCNANDILKSFERSIQQEQDFRNEGHNIENFRQVVADYPAVVIPKVYWLYSTKEILTMEWLEGQKIEDYARSVTPLVSREMAKNLMFALLLPFFREGVFHGDPHPGNVRVLADGRIAFLDFGIIGRFTAEFRNQAGELMLALWQGDVGKVVELSQDIGQTSAKINQHHFYEDMANLVNMIKGMGLEPITFGHILQGMIQISLHHGIKMPAPFFLLGKALILGESLALELDPRFNILSVAVPLSNLCLKQRIDQAANQQTIARKMLSWQEVVWDLPEELGSILKQLARGEMRFNFHHRNLQWLYEMLEVISSRLGLSIIIAAITVASALVIHAQVGPTVYGFPILGLTGFLTSVGLGAWMSVFFLRNLR
jgi:ubiquinone biosynthesis protein